MSDVTSGVPFRDDVLRTDPFALVGTRCSQGHVGFPVRGFCATCRSDEVETVPLSGRGTVHTFTVVRQAPPGLTTPYTLAQVDLDEGCRILGRVEHPERPEIAIGDLVSAQPTALVDEQGQTTVGFVFHTSHSEEERS